jgi:hypothetical protein
MPGNLSQQINDYLDSMEGQPMDTVARALLISAIEQLDSYRFVVARTTFHNDDAMEAMKFWVPNHYHNIVGDA